MRMQRKELTPSPLLKPQEQKSAVDFIALLHWVAMILKKMNKVIENVGAFMKTNLYCFLPALGAHSQTQLME